METIKAILNFIKKYQMPVSIGLSVLIMWILLGSTKSSITEKELIKMEQEMVKNILMQMDEQIKGAEKRIEARDVKINSINKLIDSLSMIQQQNKRTLDLQIIKLKKIENDIQVHDYSFDTDSALLNRLQSGN